MFQRIMLAWDGSDLARAAFDVAIDLARRYGGELVAVSVAYTPSHAETRSDRAESAEAARRYLIGTFQEIADRAHRAGVDVEHQVIEGENPARALLDHAHEHGFDLIICGHHHTRRAGRLLLHDIAGDLVREAPMPVLVVGQNFTR
jgi:nucleotide-binding universal stress UspA family protein